MSVLKELDVEVLVRHGRVGGGVASLTIGVGESWEMNSGRGRRSTLAVLSISTAELFMYLDDLRRERVRHLDLRVREDIGLVSVEDEGVDEGLERRRERRLGER